MITSILSAPTGETFQNVAAAGPLVLAFAASVLAGMASFASPCVVPLVPGYLSYLAGVSGAESSAVRTHRTARADGIAGADGAAQAPPVQLAGRWRVTGAAALFVAGFTVVFVLATASVFGAISILQLNRDLLQRIGGALTIVMGLAFVGLIPALQKDTRPHFRPISSLAGAPILGEFSAWGGLHAWAPRWRA